MSDIESLRKRKAPIEMTGDEFREAGHMLVDRIAVFIDSIRERPVNPDEQPTEIDRLLPTSLPENGMTASQLIEEFAPIFFDHSLLNGHPRFYGYVTSSAAPIGGLADLLAAAVNPNLGGWQLSPIASEIEKQSVRWIAEILGYPADGSGVFVSGGNVANFLCFLAARQARCSWDIRKRGVGESKGHMLVYATEETHTWIHKAMDLFGHGTHAIRTIPLTSHLTADIRDLGGRIEADRDRGDHPFLVVGTAGTVGTGAVDPLPAMAALAHEHNLWFHVDGAYGAPAASLPDASDDLKGLRLADSLAVDPHKWFYSPLEAGCALVKDRDALINAFSYRPPYYHFESESEDEAKINFYEYGLQNSRGFRALKTWMAIRQVGRSGVVKMIADDIALSKEMARLAESDPELEPVTQSLSITTFRYIPTDLTPGGDAVESYLNDLNEDILVRLKQSGESFFSNAVIRGMFVLRGCIVNFRTSLEDIEAFPDIVRRHGRAADAEMRPASLRHDSA